MKKIDLIKNDLIALLDNEDYDGVIAYSKKSSATLRVLIGMTYDKVSLNSWRAMDAIGRLVATFSAEKVRITAQRVLWMMREESGTNCWTAAEILGEIVYRNPEPNKDIARIVISFHDEPITCAGALRALARLAGVRADLVHDFMDVPLQYLRDDDPAVRGYALVAMDAINKKEHADAVSSMLNDGDSFLYYDGTALLETRISDMAAVVLKKLGG
jgi:hypothetical protein